jgi:exopolysaccharide production protein ExoQ
MPPTLALLLTLGFIVFLFWRDFRERPEVSTAIWLPCIWMFLVATRPASKWLAVFGIPGFVSTAVEEGSTLDATVFLCLIAMAVYVLGQRQVSLSRLIRGNRWLACFVLYCLLAVLWSDFPFVSFKRWIKILGHPIMVVLVFTEPHWEEALAVITKRCAYVVFPISICWMKYFPALGRRHDEYGASNNVGIAEAKNGLGEICLIFLLFLLWHLSKVWKQEKSFQRRGELRLTGLLILMALYCLGKAHSATSALSLLLGSATMVLLGLRFVSKRTIGVYVVGAVIVLAAAQMTFDIYGRMVELTGHEATIEGRGRLWGVLLQTDTNAIFGAGFESYWLGKRVEEIWAMPEFWWHPNQAHNGYLELYLNLGIAGLCLFAGVILATFRKILLELLQVFEWGRFEMGCLFAILAHNWTEAGFKGLGLSFLVFFIISVNYRHPRSDFDTPGLDHGLAEQAELTHSA